MVNVFVSVVGTGATEEEACRKAMTKVVRACALVPWSDTEDTLLHLIFCLEQGHQGDDQRIHPLSDMKDLGSESISAG